MTSELTLWTIGHSTHPLTDFIALLRAHRIEAVADVRSFPGSRRYPQYGRDALRESLARQNVQYQWIPALGGHRKPLPDSPNVGWRNASFRGYADYMQTEAFAAGMTELLALAARLRTTLMCAEALWWRCHRGLIADALLARGVRVEHILDAGPTTPHRGTSPARFVDGRVVYAAERDFDFGSIAT
jgi:uncharacterized protein (DUF488 family)